jgi:SAM-dependent methyltransferase
MNESKIDPAEFKVASRASWGEAAAGWRKWWRVFEAAAQPLNDRLVDLAEVKAGSVVLDIASGIGEPALTAARRAGPSGRVLATDLADPMLAMARERAREMGLANVETREMDAEHLDVAPASFDAAVCRWGVMLILDPTSACQGVRRALKPGARFATAVWGEAARVPFLAIPHEVAVREMAVPPPPPGTPGPLSMGKKGQLEALLTASGFEDLRSETMSVVFPFASPREYADFLFDLSSILRRALEVQPVEVRARVRLAIESAVERHRDASGRVRLENDVHCVSGRSPRSRA